MKSTSPIPSMGTVRDAHQFGVDPLPGSEMTLQEHAYTSPIWHTPGES
jgi:hypothetical protein